MKAKARNVGVPVGSTSQQAPEAKVSGAAQHSATRAASGAFAAHFRHLAELHGEIAATCAALAQEVGIQLATGGDLSVMGAMASGPHVDADPAALLSVQDLAGLLQVDARTVRRWRTDGKLPPAIELGGVIRWQPGVVQDWLARGGQP